MPDKILLVFLVQQCTKQTWHGSVFIECIIQFLKGFQSLHEKYFSKLNNRHIGTLGSNENVIKLDGNDQMYKYTNFKNRIISKNGRFC